MALTYLVDTSVLTRLGHPSIRAAIEPRAGRDELARAGISNLEIGYSARSEAEWDRLIDALQVFELIETTGDHVRRARQVHWLPIAAPESGGVARPVGHESAADRIDQSSSMPKGSGCSSAGTRAPSVAGCSAPRRANSRPGGPRHGQRRAHPRVATTSDPQTDS